MTIKDFFKKLERMQLSDKKHVIIVDAADDDENYYVGKIEESDGNLLIIKSK